MKCPACEGQTPMERSRCVHCDMPLPQAAQHPLDGGNAGTSDPHEPRDGRHTPRDPVDWLATPWNTGGIPVTPDEPAPQESGHLSPGDPAPWDRANMPVSPAEMTPWDAGIPRDTSMQDEGLPSGAAPRASAVAPDPRLDAHRPPGTGPAGPAYGDGDGATFSTRLDVGPAMNARDGAAPPYDTGDGPPVAGSGDASTHPFNVLDDVGPAFGVGEQERPPFAGTRHDIGPTLGRPERAEPAYRAGEAGPPYDAGPASGARDPSTHPFGALGDPAAAYGARDDSGPYAPPTFGARDAGASPDTGETRYVPPSGDGAPLTERFGAPTPAESTAFDDDDGMRYPLGGTAGERPLADEPGSRYPLDDDLGPRHPLDEDEDEGGMRYPGIKPSTGDGTRRSDRSLRTPIAAGITVAALVGGVVLYGVLHDSKPRSSQTSGSSGTPAPNSTPSDPAIQAIAVNAILQSGTDSHDKLAVPMSTCDDLSADVPVFQQVVQDRGRELARARQVQVDRLPQGTALRQAMVDAYTNALAADRAYLAWAQEVKAKNCGKKNAPRTPDYAAALTANGEARSAKRRVVTLWTPIAKQQSLPVYKWNQL